MPDELRYAPFVPWHRRRRVVRVAIAFSILAAVALGTFSFRSGWQRYQTRRAAELRRQQDMAALEQANRYTAPSTDIVWEEDPAAGAALLKDSATFMHNGAGVLRNPPIEQTRLLTRVGTTQNLGSATLFLHERANRETPRSSEGRQLLLIQLESTRGGYRHPHNIWVFRIIGILPAWTGDLGIRETNITLDIPGHLNDPNQRVRFFAGQPDPRDLSKFTIRYEINSKPGTIDGHLHFGSVVDLKIRDGPAKLSSKLKRSARAVGFVR